MPTLPSIFFTHCVNVVTKKRQRVAMGVWVYSSKRDLCWKDIQPWENNRDEKLKICASGREQELERNFVNHRTEADCETDIWAVTSGLERGLLRKKSAQLWIQQAECHPGENIRGGRRRSQILHRSKSLLTTMWKYFEFLEENISFHFDTSFIICFYNFIYKTLVIYLETGSEDQPHSFISHILLLYLCLWIVKEHKNVL